MDYFIDDSKEGSTWHNLDLNNLNISGEEVPQTSSSRTIADGLIKGLNLDPDTLMEIPVGDSESIQNRQPLNPEAKIFRTAFDWADFFGRD
jgi:hypothetical protein